MENALKTISEAGIQNVRFEVSDINGIARSKTIPARRFLDVCKSYITFPWPIYACDPLAQIVEDHHLFKKYFMSDVFFCPDVSTFTVLPWVKNTARVLLSPSAVANDVEVTVDPRQIALNQLSALKKRNLSFFSSFEYEFWVAHAETQEPLINGYNSYATLRLSKHQKFFDRLMNNLHGAGIRIECLETEYAIGQFEMPMEPEFGIQAVDNAATFRTGVKEMAMQEYFAASFMSKPYETGEGASGHLNHSLWSVDGKTPKLSDPSRPFGLSEIGEHWIAGILAHAPALSLLQSPTLNCRDRVQPGTFSPINATWGVDNRTCAVRWKRRGGHGSYIENRIGSSAGNPYISFAATIAAGIDGIDRRLPVPKDVPFNKDAHVAENIPPGIELLPTEMEGALDALLADQTMIAALGTDFIESFEQLKRHEMQVLKKHVEDGGDKFQWAKDFYFEYI
ncbi:Lengsin [Holothuria leucospilota]|uniref:Lengsin n=1 Tax=Holothuria leucospilota TaxID=206669 RepID=A0A9Q1BLI6_HOLLE|nr:Lengsin [Holothuria leucospilota]